MDNELPECAHCGETHRGTYKGAAELQINEHGLCEDCAEAAEQEAEEE